MGSSRKAKRDAAWRVTAWRQARVTPQSRGPDYPVCDCPFCGKKSYRSRAAAGREAVRLFPGKRMRIYQCGDWWHMTSYNAAQTERFREHYRGREEAG